jgi:hypothetical protein
LVSAGFRRLHLLSEGSAAGLFGFGIVFVSVTGPEGHAPSLKLSQNAKIPRCQACPFLQNEIKQSIFF